MRFTNKHLNFLLVGASSQSGMYQNFGLTFQPEIAQVIFREFNAKILIPVFTSQILTRTLVQYSIFVINGEKVPYYAVNGGGELTPMGNGKTFLKIVAGACLEIFTYWQTIAT